MKIYRNVILQNIDLRGELKGLRKENQKLRNEIIELENLNDKELIRVEKYYEKKFKNEAKRLDTLAEDNRRLIIIDRKKDKEIQELKQQLRKDQKSV